MKRNPVKIGLTGSIGMGKSTTAAMFAEAGIPVWDADAAVHRLYAKNGGAARVVAEIAPEAIANGAVDRAALKRAIASDPSLLKKVEAVVHPMVAKDRASFTLKYTNEDSDLIVFDIPLLFETNGHKSLDVVIVVSTTTEKQRRRVLARQGMTVEHFDQILSLQVPDKEKRERADYVIETDTPEAANKAVQTVIKEIRAKINA
jgi:dephospho-CoA kinase